MSFQTETAIASADQEGAMQEEVAVSVKLAFSCLAELSLSEQKAWIENDIVRLMDADSTTGVFCTGYKITNIDPEVHIYSGRKQENNVPKVQADRMNATLSDHYDLDPDQSLALLEYALADLRHFADERGLDFGAAHAASYTSYLLDRSA